MRREERIILLAHGSRNTEADEELQETALQVQDGLSGARVIPAFLQFNRPNLTEALEQAVAEGAKRIIVVLFFLASGIHVRQDIPEELEQARQRHPGVEILLSRPLLPDPRIAAILLDRIKDSGTIPKGECKPMMNSKRLIFLGLIALTLMCQACASVIPSRLRKQVDKSITFEEVRNNPDGYLGRKVLLGGKITKVSKPDNQIQFEVANKELEQSGIPTEKWHGPIQIDGLRDRFLLSHEGPLDKGSYREGGYLTSVGEVVGSEVFSFGQREFSYPVIRCEFVFFHEKPNVERVEKWSLNHLVGQAIKDDFIMNLGLPTRKGRTGDLEVWEYFISYGRSRRADILPKVPKHEAYDDLNLRY